MRFLGIDRDDRRDDLAPQRRRLDSVRSRFTDDKSAVKQKAHETTDRVDSVMDEVQRVEELWSRR